MFNSDKAYLISMDVSFVEDTAERHEIIKFIVVFAMMITVSEAVTSRSMQDHGRSAGIFDHTSVGARGINVEDHTA